jgi:4-hydroxy-4-methyl-2-oxoglutarate aldolase
MIFSTPDDIRAMTPLNPFSRSEDGRPYVPDSLLERTRQVTAEEAWSVLRRQHNYRFQFAGGWPVHLHPDVTLVGRAVTAVFAPTRPDLEGAVDHLGQSQGRVGRHNLWIIEMLAQGDVLVVDLFGKIEDGTLVGDNLGTRVRAKTGTGLVIEGAFRDRHGLEELGDFPIFARGVDPSAIADATLIGVNVPVRIGGATALPGDVVLGTRTGVTFIPPHLIEEVIAHSEETQMKDIWGKMMLAEGRFDSAQIDVVVWEPAVNEVYQEWRKTQG